MPFPNDRQASRCVVLKSLAALSLSLACSALHAQTTYWSVISTEGQSFGISGVQTVRYGTGERWVEKTVSGSGLCSNAFFGRDPAPNVVKLCQVQRVNVGPWQARASEGQGFSLSSARTVRYGAGTQWIERQVTGQVACTSTFFGLDPYYGVRKSCETLESGLSQIQSQRGVAGVNDPLASKQWNLTAIQAEAAWAAASSAGTRVRVAVIDSGYSGHKDIRWVRDQDAAGNLLLSYGNDSQAHGTHVAGIVAGLNNNGEGIAGVCPQCDVVPILADPSHGDAVIAEAIRTAVRHDVRVINMSFVKAGVSCASAPQTQDAIAAALKAGVVVVASAGNYGSSFDTGASATQQAVADTYPAGCPGVISVGATEGSNQFASYSNRGATLVAPGGGTSSPDGAYGAGVGCTATNAQGQTSTSTVGILSTWHTGPGTACYRHLSGTSMAAPHVAGVAGMMLAVNPALTPAQVKSVLESTATRIESCSTADCGKGLLNAAAAVAAAKTQPVVPLAADEWRPATYTGVCKWAVSLNANCLIDTIDELPTGELSITAYGRIWHYNQSFQRIRGPERMTSLLIYTRADGPCSPTVLRRSGTTGLCRFDNRTVVNYSGLVVLDSVGVGPYYWNFDGAGQPFEGQGIPVGTVDRYRNYVCNDPTVWAGGEPCTFENRVVVDFPEWGGIIESVYRKGKYYNFNGAGERLQGISGEGFIQDIARYRNHICGYKPANETFCRFDSRELKQDRNEVITAYGRYFEFQGETLVREWVLKDTVPFK